MRQVAYFIILSFVLVSNALGQVLDDFSDGDFTSNPAWSGQDSLWTVVPFDVDSAVQLNGVAASDTAYLSTPSTVSYGTWKIGVRYEGGRLSNFNQVRVFLSASSPDLLSAVTGYQIQLGTNDRNIRLYRLDPAAPDGRVLLSSSADNILALDDATVALEVTRSTSNEWTIVVDAAPVVVFTESSGAVETSSHFGVWIKHSASRNQHYYFDDVDVSDSLPPDETPPIILASTYNGTSNAIEVQFNESLDPGTVVVANFDVNNGVGQPQSSVLANPTSGPPNSFVTLNYSATIPTGDYTLTAIGISDATGNTATSLSSDFSVVSDTEPPALVSASVKDSRHIVVNYSEVVAPSSACVASNYTISGSVGRPARVLCPSGAAVSVELEYATPLGGGAYTLTAMNISDLSGNVLVTGTASFSVDVAGDTPNAGDIVINELSYDPGEANLEFIELLNVSTKTFALSEFEFSDNRIDRVNVTSGAELLAPGQYAVLVRDGALFASVFTSVAFIVPPSWPALNNSGDASILFFGTTTIDSVAFLPSWGGSDVSLERKDPAGPSNSASNWASSTDAAGGTPGRQNSVFGPDLAPPVAVFAEQLTSTVVRVYFNEPISASSAVPSNFESGGINAISIKLLNGDERVDVEFSTVASDINISRIADVTGNVLESATLAIAQYPESTELRITEIMYDPLSDDSDGLQDQIEFIELLNTGNRTLSLAGLYWTDSPNEDGEADTLRLALQATGIPPSGFAVIFAQAKAIAVEDVYAQSDLVLAYPRNYRSDGTALLPYTSSSLGLLNDGDLIRLHRADDVILDEVLYDPKWHYPGLRDATGTSLERIDPDGPSSDGKNWSSSVSPNGATPGLQNSIHLTFVREETDGRLTVNPSTFSPDYDGVDDFAAIQYDLQSAQSTIRVRIFDSRGAIIRELEPAALASQSGTVIWDGRNDDGNELRIGIYVVFLEAVDIESGITEAYKTAVVLARILN